MEGKGFFAKIEENMIAVGIIIMVIMETLNVIVKRVAPAGAGIPEEIAVFTYIWVCFLCASYCTKKGSNIVVDVLSSKYSPAVKQYLQLIQHGLDIVLSVMFVYGGVLFVAATKAGGAVGVTGIPLWIVYIAPVVGFGLTIIRNIQMIIKAIKKDKVTQEVSA